MNSSDFGSVQGGMLEGITLPIENFYKAHTGMVILAIIVAIVILFILTFTSLGVASKKEGIDYSCGRGTTPAICGQTRESLTQSALATGYAADPNAFCANAGTPTDDPYDYLRTNVANLPKDGSESLSNIQDERNRLMVASMQGLA